MLFRARALAAANAARADGRAAASWVATALVLAAGVPPMARTLAVHAAAWAARGPEVAEARLHVTLILSWLAAFAVGTISAAAVGFATRSARLLATVPIAHVSRFRALALQTLAGRTAIVLLVEAVVTGRAARAAGTSGLIWDVSVLGGGTACAVLGSAAATAGALLLFGEGRARWRAVPLAGAAAAPFAVALAALVHGAAGAPVLAAGALVSGAAALLGPVAGAAGRATLWALVAADARGRGDGRCRRSRIAEGMLSRRRGVTGALLYRGYLARLRNPFTYLRFCVMSVLVASFPALARVVCPTYLSRRAFVAGYALAVMQLVVHEVTVQALAGEGARLTLLLQAPRSCRQLLSARFASALLPVATIAVAVTAVLGALARMPWADVARVEAAVALVSFGVTAFLTLGSSLDADLGRVVDTAMEAIFADDAPTAPTRLALLAAAVALQVPCVVMLDRVPLGACLAALALADVTLVAAMMVLAARRLAGLVGGERFRAPAERAGSAP